ncbi:MAG: hydantoinase B/oxoprolinase family protein, partial [Gammaproteobacteria bacterium]|nr:hydantoinase B/oxoprolinase family protein [Gammaproteobacteria bacterium]
MDAISLSVFFSRIEAVCDEMGAVLKRVAFSPNIKDRLDFSCAVFDPRGELCAQAAHIPVHLGSMAYAMQGIVSAIDWHEGDMVIMNDPYLGGTHLPDVTVIAPLFVDQQLAGFVVNRAHHADIGAESPGSMPISKDLHEEGLVIPPTKMVQQGEMQQTVIKRLMQAMRNPVESMGDFTAQVSANKKGLQRLEELVSKQDVVSYLNGLTELNEYAQRLAGNALSSIPDGEYFFEDVMDDDGQGNTDLPVKVNLIIKQGQIRADFTGTSKQVVGNINCPLSVAAAAVYYVFRCLMPAHTPACAGSFRSISINAPEGCLVNASRPAAVAAGNV